MIKARDSVPLPFQDPFLIPRTWNYNDLIDFSKIYSPYHQNNLRFIETESSFFIGSYMIVYEAIKGDALIDILDSSDTIKKILITKKFREFYEFLCEIGIEYGFIHNDLHLRNLIYDENTQSIKIIDFGRSSFNNEYAILKNNDFLLEARKLNLRDFDENNVYESIFNKGNKFLKSYTSINGNFLGILSEIISLSLSFYINIEELFNDLKVNFSNLLELNITSVKIKFTHKKEILKEYLEILLKFDENFYTKFREVDEDIKYTIRYLLDGLFLAALYFKFCGLKEGVYTYEKLTEKKIMSKYRILLIDQGKLDNFISYVCKFLSTVNPYFKPLLSKNYLLQKLSEEIKTKREIVKSFIRSIGFKRGGIQRRIRRIKKY